MGGKRILVIDDDQSILSLFTLILQRKGHMADTAKTGFEALERISRKLYNIALIDVVLPDMSGLDLLDNIPSETRKIVITGVLTEDSRVRARLKGADDYLLKPVKPEKLLELIG